jgi:hypothetical protein
MLLSGLALTDCLLCLLPPARSTAHCPRVWMWTDVSAARQVRTVFCELAQLRATRILHMGLPASQQLRQCFIDFERRLLLAGGCARAAPVRRLRRLSLKSLRLA